MELSVYNNGSEDKCFVFGNQFGPEFVALTDDIEDALDEWDERFGQPVDDDLSMLSLYEGDTDECRMESALNCGEIRINSGGTTVWVDHYEWMKEFDTLSEAFAFIFGISDR